MAGPRDWYTESVGGGTWTTSEDSPFLATITFQDSIECGGTACDAQIGTAVRCFVLDTPTLVTLTLDGAIEGFRVDYDRARIELLDGNGLVTMVSESSSTVGTGCTAASKSKSIGLTLDPGDYVLVYHADTVDYRFHKNAYWAFKAEPLGSAHLCRPEPCKATIELGESVFEDCCSCSRQTCPCLSIDSKPGSATCSCCDDDRSERQPPPLPITCEVIDACEDSLF